MVVHSHSIVFYINYLGFSNVRVCKSSANFGTWYCNIYSCMLIQDFWIYLTLGELFLLGKLNPIICQPNDDNSYPFHGLLGKLNFPSKNVQDISSFPISVHSLFVIGP